MAKNTQVLVIKILGTPYKIKFVGINDDEYCVKNNLVGYCDSIAKTIVVTTPWSREGFEGYNKEELLYEIRWTLRHEIIHAFLNESGLEDCASKSQYSWAKNEEMVDWFAIQIPKINEIMNSLEERIIAVYDRDKL